MGTRSAGFSTNSTAVKRLSFVRPKGLTNVVAEDRFALSYFDEYAEGSIVAKLKVWPPEES